MDLDWTPEVPANIATLVPYPPGKPIEETKREYGISEVIKLASNENPLGPSPKALDAIRAAHSGLNLYPDGSHYALKTALASKLGCSVNRISIGNGSNELIDLLIRVFVPPQANVVAQERAFIAYKLCAQLQGCGFSEAPVDSGFRVSADAVLATINDGTRVVFLANPNNPTGSWMGGREVRRLARELDTRKILLALDYAYWEYVTEPSIPDPMALAQEFGNVVVLRTFSKIYGLAGLRVGYAVAAPKIIALLERARQPFNVNALALAGAAAALSDDSFVARSKKLNAEGLAALQGGLARFDVDVYPRERGAKPQGNFLLVDFKRPVQPYFPEFLKRGVIIRPVGNYGLPTFFRITAGKPEENEKLLRAIHEVLR